MMTPKLIIFDMDGLMIDTEPVAIAGWEAVARELNITIPHELLLSVIGINRVLCKVYMLEALGPDFDYDKALMLLHKNINQHFETHGVPQKPGITQLLDKLDELGIKKAVATSSSFERATYKLTKAGLIHRFDAIIGGNMVARSKPDPDIFLKAAKVVGISPSDCIVLEDSNPGAEGAVRAGMRVVVVPDLVPPTDVTRKQAYAVCNSLHDVYELVTELAQR